jgi:sphingomyelin phosphodiesterase acid-like 3
MVTLLATLIALSVAPCSAHALAQQGDQIWLVVSDLHLDLFDRSLYPSPPGSDTNVALLVSALSQMKRATPYPSVILLPGDFLMHHFLERIGPNAGSPQEAAIRTMRWIAAAFNRAFPKARFAIALGNNDSPCGDYRSANGSAYLAAVARAWTPLVNRYGASADFESSFGRGGYYTATLPVRGLRLVVLNTVLFSSLYGGDCAGSHSQAAADELEWLRTTLHSSRTRNVVLMHIPPGFDATSTQYVRGFLAWPFLKSRYNDALIGTLAAPSDRVAYAIAGHTHRFDFRLARSVPVIVAGALSPIYGNNPAFYALRISSDGSLRDIVVYSFDQYAAQAWLPPHSFDRTWSKDRIDAASLARLHARLTSASARVLWSRQANGWISLPDRRGWGGRWWRVFWCAQDLFVSNFSQCAGIQRRVQILGPLVAAIAAAVTILGLVVVRRMLMPKRPPRQPA